MRLMRFPITLIHRSAGGPMRPTLPMSKCQPACSLLMASR
jgi:hypothetical protein